MMIPKEPNRTWFPGWTSALCKIGLHTTWHANVQLHTGLNISQAEFPRSILIKMKIPKPKWNENIKTLVISRDPHRAHTIATLLSNQIACGTIESQIKQTNVHFTRQIYIVMSSQETPESKWLQVSLIEHTSELHSSLNKTACGTIESWCLNLRSNKQTNLSNTIQVISHQETPKSIWLQESLIEHAPQLHSSSNRLLLPAARARCLGVPSESSGARPPPRREHQTRGAPRHKQWSWAAQAAAHWRGKSRPVSSVDVRVSRIQEEPHNNITLKFSTYCGHCNPFLSFDTR